MTTFSINNSPKTIHNLKSQPLTFLTFIMNWYNLPTKARCFTQVLCLRWNCSQKSSWLMHEVSIAEITWLAKANMHKTCPMVSKTHTILCVPQLLREEEKNDGDCVCTWQSNKQQLQLRSIPKRVACLLTFSTLNFHLFTKMKLNFAFSTIESNKSDPRNAMRWCYQIARGWDNEIW